MSLEGKSLIGKQAVAGSEQYFKAINPYTGEPLEPAYGSLSPAQIDHACMLAAQASNPFSETTPKLRAQLLETIAQELESIIEPLVARAHAETGLPVARLQAETGRTCQQLRLFAEVLEAGYWVDARVDSAQPERPPAPRPDLRQRHIALGPVAVFGASNFPLAFSVAGGDTASALAAGCPVVVKAHPAHPGTSELVGRAIQRAVGACKLPEGVFSLLFGAGNELGQALVSHPAISAVGFTGSRAGGLALMAIAAARPVPIPVYAEMSSINPVFLMPQALSSDAERIADGFIASQTLFAGQFCTNPGLLIAIKGASLDRFISSAVTALENSTAYTMLTPGIHAAYERSVAALASNPSVRLLGRGPRNDACHGCQAGLFATSADAFLTDQRLHAEVFGATSLLVECDDFAQMQAVARCLEGQLTATLQCQPADYEQARLLLPILERLCGRLIANGWPTGVEVAHAMVHGGPFPASSDTHGTSVGSLAIRRFLRAVCYQSMPDELRPASLSNHGTTTLPVMLNGSLTLPSVTQ